MAKKCPKCGDPNSLDYDPDFKIWRCVWVDCNYEEKGEQLIVAYNINRFFYILYNGINRAFNRMDKRDEK